MSTTNGTGHVSATECATLRDRYAEGETVSELVTARGWTHRTILTHLHGVCSHGDADAGTDDCVVDRPHLTQDPPTGTRHAASNPEEAYCRSCDNRITITPEGLEVGHRHAYPAHSGCEHRPDELDSS